MKTNENLKRGTVELVILQLLSLEDMYGYQIVQELEKKSEGCFVLKEGSLYPSLYRMIDRKWISDTPVLVGKRRTRIYYHLEEAGIAALEDLKKSYYNFVEGITTILNTKPVEK